MARERKTTDGTGAPLVPDGLYFVQDARTFVGNCGSWWCPDGAGYTCDIDRAGKYRGDEVTGMRETDVPWPVDYVMKHVVRHVRVDSQAFNRNDDVFIAAQKHAEELARSRRSRRRG